MHKIKYGADRVKQLLTSYSDLLPYKLDNNDQFDCQPTSIGANIEVPDLQHFLSCYIIEKNIDCVEEYDENWRLIWPSASFVRNSCGNGGYHFFTPQICAKLDVGLVHACMYKYEKNEAGILSGNNNGRV
jgi:hypothetical protein